MLVSFYQAFAPNSVDANSSHMQTQNETTTTSFVHMQICTLHMLFERKSRRKFTPKINVGKILMMFLVARGFNPDQNTGRKKLIHLSRFVMDK